MEEDDDKKDIILIAGGLICFVMISVTFVYMLNFLIEFLRI
jgi:hypothetical protein